ncbi:CLAVATA3/ESR (CLE)-related 25 -like protein [Gossypium arboreum]|uniref:Uncharacterized protein n=4 Tax=Gossypium TaxID=3633 RepID=A0ABR0R430_GOSAR|nr:CLAVATA3/ESR (CLE)-related protein 25-like [Gossypium arboreum]KAK5845842.1 hypothetical protein PVK06_002075 [Gossypium arboreum]KHG13308.1 CLAVATA3/ESR (CLE)-related 25 -like protein [Gossypium arboreum]TYH31301.1 hypothetical protein ES288_A01G162900v1 [Gossypium darwinii]TYI43449.1 hypothetical protein ES332_A01G170600v1 [Gossypium tomentosum]
MSGGSSLLFRTLFGTLIVLGFILGISVGFLKSEGNEKKTTITSDDHQSSTTTAKVQHEEEQVKVLGQRKSNVAHPKQDLNYMSKRRVPNGPDPIHNRRAGNSGRPPGQV